MADGERGRGGGGGDEAASLGVNCSFVCPKPNDSCLTNSITLYFQLVTFFFFDREHVAFNFSFPLFRNLWASLVLSLSGLQW